MADDERKKLEEEKKRKQAEIERKRAEVRARMEEASKAKKAKKGFMTPERKKKLRLLLRKKAAEELKKEQERKAAERRRIIEERCGKPKLVDDANEGQLKKICKDYYDRMYICEEQKWDLEREVRKRDWEISDLNSQVNDLRGKFVKPPLKKVSKYENKFAKLQKKAAEFNFRNQLKVVKKKEFTLEEEDKENAQKVATAAKKKPDWSKKGDEKKEGDEAEGASPAEGTSPAEGEPAEGQPPVESQPPAESPAEGQPATEGELATQPSDGTAEETLPTESVTSAEGASAIEGQPPAEEAPAGGFETFKNLVINENYDIVALPETILAPTENKDAVAIPNYSLVENRRNSGDGVLLYIKDSLKYKVVDLTSDNPEAHLSFEDLLERIKKNGHAAEGVSPAEGVPQPTEGSTPTTTESDQAPAQGAQPIIEDAQPPSEGPLTAAEGTAVPTENAPVAADEVPVEGTSVDGDPNTEGAEQATPTTESTTAEVPANEVANEPLLDVSPEIASPPVIEAAA